jgi:periplasmic divalent cation tolerance protein
VANEILVLVTTQNTHEADKIAYAVVFERLAACVNVVPWVESHYWWEGEVTRESETLLIIKTTYDRYERLERRVKELHSYTTPEVIAVEITRGSNEYLKWLRDSVLEVADSGEDHS